MPRRDYANPPVHEVILDVQFQKPLSASALESLRDQLSPLCGTPTRSNTFEVSTALSSGGPNFHGESKFLGWEFSEGQNEWVTRAYSDRLTLHSARTGKWPKGPYVGWEQVYNRFVETYELAATVYEGSEPKRLGLRYLNRILLPKSSDFSSLLPLLPKAQTHLHELFAFNIQHTWAQVQDYPRLACTVRLSRIEVPEEVGVTDAFGVLMDIEIFNLYIKHACAFPKVPEWFADAHRAENIVFENCISDKLRQQFDKAPNP